MTLPAVFVLALACVMAQSKSPEGLPVVVVGARAGPAVAQQVDRVVRRVSRKQDAILQALQCP